MRILVVAPEFPPAVGGMEVHALQVARYLARRHAVAVLAPALRPSPPAAEPLVVFRQLQRQFWSSVARIGRTMRAYGPDALLVLNAGYTVLGHMTAVPVVTRVVGNDFYKSWIGPHLPLRSLFWRLPVDGAVSPGRWLRRADQVFRNRFTVWGLGSSRRILCNSSFTKAALRDQGVDGPRVQVVAGGVDTSVFHPQPRAEARARLGLPQGKLISTAARLTPKKGIDTALRALHGLLPKHPDLIYAVLGEGRDEPRLRALARELGLEGHVRFIGNVSHGELPGYLAASDVYLQPSRTAADPVTGHVDVETMGRAVGEASACGVAVLATSSGGLPDMVCDGVTGRLVPENDADALAQALAQLLRDAELRSRLGSAGAELARRRFSWEAVGELTERALLESLSEGR